MIGIAPESLSDIPASTEDPLAFLDQPTKLDPSAVPKTPEKSLGEMATQFLNTSGINFNAPKTLSVPNAISNNAGMLGVGALGVAGLAAAQDVFKDNTAPASTNPFVAQNVNWNMADWSAPEGGVTYGQAYLNPEFSPVNAASGGIMSLAGGGMTSLGGYASGGNPRLLKGPGDGMSDNIPATIANKQPARLADGEFVVPADVVSHLGNGSTEAGAKVLYNMMDRVRKARTGNSKQGKQINPQKFIPLKGK
jgi:hypothetical protein